jgi:hypothetical protein
MYNPTVITSDVFRRWSIKTAEQVVTNTRMIADSNVPVAANPTSSPGIKERTRASVRDWIVIVRIK